VYSTGNRQETKTGAALERGLALFVVLFITLIALPVHAQGDEYNLNFDIPDVEDKSGFEFWGQAELRAYSKFLDEDSALYKQKYFNKAQENPAHEFLLQIKPEVSWKQGEVGAYIRPRLEVGWSQMVGGSSAKLDEPSETLFDSDKYWAGKILAEEAFVNWSPSPSQSFEVGKKVLKWGKGYAWNPTSFIARPKDVNDPDQSREGYYLAFGDFISSHDGTISTIAFTPVVSTVSENINEGLADGDTTLVGGKLYILAYDTDFDVMVMGGDKYDTRIGADFATNLAENFAIHGEAALRMGYTKTTVDSGGNTSVEDINAWSFLLGMRYLTETDTTYIAEYYHNGEGYSSQEMRSYYTLINDGFDAYQATASTALLKASNKVSSYYNQSSAGRDYLYFRVSQKEPFDILYLTPTLTTILNLGDGSFSLNPELAYQYSTNLEIRPRLTIPIGAAKTEYGEKVNKINAELRFTYFY
jgi:hypothetical protein